MRREVDRLATLFLKPDNEDPRIFNEEARGALQIVVGLVVEAEDVFSNLRRLKSDSARRDQSDWLATCVFANIASVDLVKSTIEFGLADCEVERNRPLPKDMAELRDEHRREFRLLRRAGGEDNTRAKRLLRLLQLELIWFGQMW